MNQVLIFDRLDPKECDHEWQPVSFRFESQLLDDLGRVRIRQPDIDEGRVYMVCLRCASHTYISTSWVKYRLEGSEDRDYLTEAYQLEGSESA